MYDLWWTKWKVLWFPLSIPNYSTFINCPITDNIWEDNIKVDLVLGLWCEMDSSGTGQDPLVASCEHANEPSGYKQYRIL
jgi:hypothetical protein